MRKIITILSIAAFLFSFTAEGQVKKKKNKAQTVQTDKKTLGAKNTSSLKGKKGKKTSKKMIAYPIDTESSSIQWTGKKMIGAFVQIGRIGLLQGGQAQRGQPGGGYKLSAGIRSHRQSPWQARGTPQVRGFFRCKGLSCGYTCDEACY